MNCPKIKLLWYEQVLRVIESFPVVDENISVNLDRQESKRKGDSWRGRGCHHRVSAGRQQLFSTINL